MTGLARTLCLIVWVALILPAAAQDAAEPRDAVRAVIEGQMQAFQRDDGVAAYEFASPSIRQIFPNVDIFMDMVRRGYQPVYRPKGVVFGALKEAEGRFLQEVRLVGPDDQDYLALYTLERQSDGSFRIAGCTVVRIEGQGT